MGRNWKRAQPHGPAPRQFLTRQLFFRWIKQTLKIKHFLGTSENAMRIHGRGPRGAVPTLLTWRKPDHVTRPDFLDRATPALYAVAAGALLMT